MASDTCLLCAERFDRRVLLHSAANRHALPVLSELVEEMFGSSFVDTVLPAGISVCRPCFRRVEKMTKLKKDLLREGQVLRRQLQRAGEIHGLSLCSSPSVCSPRRKHTAHEAALSSPSPKRSMWRFVSSTPVKRALNTLVVPESQTSPAVAVSVL